jgi:hypothetical protein
VREWYWPEWLSRFGTIGGGGTLDVREDAWTWLGVAGVAVVPEQDLLPWSRLAGRVAAMYSEGRQPPPTSRKLQIYLPSSSWKVLVPDE